MLINQILDVPWCHPDHEHQTGDPLFVWGFDRFMLEDVCPLAWIHAAWLFRIECGEIPEATFTKEGGQYVVRILGYIWRILEYDAPRDCYLIEWPD